MEPIPSSIEDNSIADKMNHLERYRFFGFDNSMDKPKELTNGTSSANNDSVTKLEKNPINV